MLFALTPSTLTPYNKPPRSLPHTSLTPFSSRTPSPPSLSAPLPHIQSCLAEHLVIDLSHLNPLTHSLVSFLSPFPSLAQRPPAAHPELLGRAPRNLPGGHQHRGAGGKCGRCGRCRRCGGGKGKRRGASSERQAASRTTRRKCGGGGGAGRRTAALSDAVSAAASHYCCCWPC